MRQRQQATTALLKPNRSRPGALARWPATATQPSQTWSPLGQKQLPGNTIPGPV